MTYYTSAVNQHGHALPAIRPGVPNWLDIATESAAEAEESTADRLVILTADADCHVAFGSGEDFAATTDHTPLWAKTVWPVEVPAGVRIAVIAAGATEGRLCITPAQSA